MVNRRGAALAIVVVTALICAIAAYGILILVRGQAGRALAFQQRLKARYASEAGLWIAMAKLRNFPSYPESSIPGTTVTTPCPSAGGVIARAEEAIDFDGNGPSANDQSVEITVTNCGAGRTHKVTAKVVY